RRPEHPGDGGRRAGQGRAVPGLPVPDVDPRGVGGQLPPPRRDQRPQPGPQGGRGPDPDARLPQGAARADGRVGGRPGVRPPLPQRGVLRRREEARRDPPDGHAPPGVRRPGRDRQRPGYRRRPDRLRGRQPRRRPTWHRHPGHHPLRTDPHLHQAPVRPHPLRRPDRRERRPRAGRDAGGSGLRLDPREIPRRRPRRGRAGGRPEGAGRAARGRPLSAIGWVQPTGARRGISGGLHPPYRTRPPTAYDETLRHFREGPSAMATDLNLQVAGIKDEYKYGFHDSEENYAFKSGKGLTREIVCQISEMKNEPQWMRDFRLKALEVFRQKPTPTWGGDLSELNFDDIHYYMKAADRQGKSWDDVPAEIKNTFEKLGIPEAERKF